MSVLKKIIVLKNNSFFQIAIVLIAVTFLLLLYFFNNPAERNFPKCIFNQLTGLYCPGCGSQRALSALLHGNFLLALHDNLLIVCCIPLLFYAAYIFVWNIFHTEKKGFSFFYSSAFAIIFLIVVIVFTVVRNIHAEPFTFLAPLL
jgi:hypothetical protein